MHGSHVDCQGFAESPRQQKYKWLALPSTAMNLSNKLFLNPDVIDVRGLDACLQQIRSAIVTDSKNFFDSVARIASSGLQLEKRDCQMRSCPFVKEKKPPEQFVNGWIPINSWLTLFPRPTNLRLCCWLSNVVGYRCCLIILS